MCKDDTKISSLIDPDKKVKIPVYSSIRLIDGEIVGELEGFEELPAELLPSNDYDIEGICKWLAFKDTRQKKENVGSLKFTPI